MRLSAMIFEPRPSRADPLGQRGYVGLVWEADKELIEVPFDDTKQERAARVAWEVAVGVFLRLCPEEEPSARLDAMIAFMEKARGK